MISEIANKFQEITKFDLYQYFVDYADFMRNQFPYVRAYYAGESESIDAVIFDTAAALEKPESHIFIFPFRCFSEI